MRDWATFPDATVPRGSSTIAVIPARAAYAAAEDDVFPVDATITASGKSKLGADKPANLTRMDVDTNNGTVYLNGTVETAEQKTKAEQLAWQAKGVKNVVNNLQVQKR